VGFCGVPLDEVRDHGLDLRESSTAAYRIQSIEALAPPSAAEHFMCSAIRCNVESGGHAIPLPYPCPRGPQQE
jgi:hypothetical protein